MAGEVADTAFGTSAATCPLERGCVTTKCYHVPGLRDWPSSPLESHLKRLLSPRRPWLPPASSVCWDQLSPSLANRAVCPLSLKPKTVPCPGYKKARALDPAPLPVLRMPLSLKPRGCLVY